jgi:curved DNA-binding protein CbpA
MAVVGDPRGFYDLLGVPRTATPEEIKASFRELAKAYHPDGGSADEERFRRLREAYEVLRDPHRRLQYDAESLDAERRHDWARWGSPRADEGGERSLPDLLGAVMAVLRSPPVLGVLALLVLLLLVTGTMLVQRGQEAARLRVELSEARAALAAARRATPPAARPDPGGKTVYAAKVAFPADSAELDEGYRAALSGHLSALQTAVDGLPAGSTWSVLVEGQSLQAASETGVSVDAWELALLRVATVTELLVLSGVPAERVAVRFIAGSAPPASAEGSDVVGLELLCCHS